MARTRTTWTAGGRSPNPKGRPRKGDSLAEVIRQRWDAKKRQTAIDSIAAKASDGDIQAFDVLAKRGWPDEAKGELSLHIPEDAALPIRIIHEHHEK